MVAVLGFQFGLYHVVVPLSFLRSISLASLFSGDENGLEAWHIDESSSSVVWTPIDNGILANQIARPVVIEVKNTSARLDIEPEPRTPPPPAPTPDTFFLLLHNASWETGYHCNFCNGGFAVTCIPGDSLSRIYKGKGVYLRMLFHIKLIFLIRSQPFCPAKWGKKVPVFL